jgi:8-oxo-dGTP diphosphatase/2-hydroxy-dATP diphosphatase
MIHQDGKILLGMKKRGFGQGRWNGFGGKIQEGERIEDAAKRELQEEAGLAAEEIVEQGLLEFEFRGSPEILEVHAFRVNRFTGEPQETEEMKPQWFPVDGIPYEIMWPDDRHWLPMFLQGKKFHGIFIFDGSDTILKYQLEEVEHIQ